MALVKWTSYMAFNMPVVGGVGCHCNDSRLVRYRSELAECYVRYDHFAQVWLRGKLAREVIMSKTDLIGPFRQPMNALLWPKGSHSHYKYPKSLSVV